MTVTCTRPRRVVSTACLVVLLALVAPARLAQADEKGCLWNDVIVQGADRRDTHAACSGAVDAIAFLANNGLATAMPVVIRVVPRLPRPAGDLAHGCYVRAEQRVYMLAYAGCLKLSGRSGLPLDRTIYRSLVAHEVAHHIAAANFSIDRPTVVAQEYIAYVTMFATMEPDARARLLERFPGTGFTAERQISLTYYELNPNGFGAQAYRHFMQPGNGAAFLARVLAGLALSEEDPP